MCMQTHSGAVACQIMDALHPNVVPMTKVSTDFELVRLAWIAVCIWADQRTSSDLFEGMVADMCCGIAPSLCVAHSEVGFEVQVKFSASTEYDMIQNYKILQNVFNKLNLTKVRASSAEGSYTILAIQWQPSTRAIRCL